MAIEYTLRNGKPILCCALIAACLPAFAMQAAAAQTAGAQAAPSAAEVRLAQLTLALEQTQQRVEQSQRDLLALQQEVQAMKQQLAAGASPGIAPAGAGSAQAAAEREEMQANQIATLDQVKVESASKYPLRVTGTLLLNGFVNTGRVDQAAAPSSALGGPGSVGLSVTQTVLGLDADGPHLFGAVSHADVRADFFGTGNGDSYNGSGGLLRLRTAHAALDWKRTQIFFSLDRALINPNAPESLLAVAQPELAWSGNLWSWNPQAGISHTLGTRTRLRLQAAFIDPSDPTPSTGINSAASASALPTVNAAEASRQPGAEARIAVLGSDDRNSAQIGIGGYFSPHFIATNSFGAGTAFDAWAATIDYKLPLSHGFVLSGSAYRGLALGGLGGGGYKDYVYRTVGSSLQIRPLEDAGGWAQLHQAIGQRVSWNVGFGMDNAFARQLRAYPGSSSANVYGSIGRNRTFFGNVIYSPSTYLQLSVEYRNLYTAPAPGRLWISNTTGVGAAYRF